LPVVELYTVGVAYTVTSNVHVPPEPPLPVIVKLSVWAATGVPDPVSVTVCVPVFVKVPEALKL
jgi:hypothetical protein